MVLSRVQVAWLSPRRAYEIKYFHHREPPPKEILEDLTPKGGDLLNRTMENFQPPPKRSTLSMDPNSTVSGDEATNTPNDEKMDIGDNNDSGAGGVRTMRGGKWSSQKNPDDRSLVADHDYVSQVFGKRLRRGFPFSPMYHQHDRCDIHRLIPSPHLSPETTMRQITTTKTLPMKPV